MSPKEEASFYLYSIGYSPALITLGTLVYRNYANPDHRCVSLSGIDENELVMQNLVSITEIDGCCWASAKSSTYGFGLRPLDLASVTSKYATSLQKMVVAEAGRRVTLNHPVRFFETKVLQHPDIRRELAIWLTAAKSSYLLRKATFQKPKVYCVTGLFELRGVRARVGSSSDINLDLGVSAEMVGAPTGIPIGLEIGPFSNNKYLMASVAMRKPAIWAARFHRLDVEYIRGDLEAELKPGLPTTIRLRPDVTDPGRGLMGDTGEEDEELYGEAQVLVGSNVQLTTGARMRMNDAVEEMSEDYCEEDEYSKAFAVAKHRIDEDAAASDEDDMNEDV
ncbi:uncharacterized protein B0T15DRAFT_563571 [Chaetomium strumarium]|uniref:Uncharacterized protein n=1 Tax=Chaetomium strumarium TaxID=1170767 RepID=A0AAJ0GL07_9PEZI|nr:hypothetical protein B0T15DRAFT_563571 [Chaetomium strumarium]